MTSIAEPNDGARSATAGPVSGTASAGAMIRAARQAHGFDVARVAAALKVPPRKLELLEADRYEDLLDPSFTRALAKSVCRHLKIDADPVLARLPQGSGYRLERLGDGLNTPLREYGEPRGRTLLRSPAVWIALLLVLGAVAVMLLPIDVERVRRWISGDAPASAAPAAGDSPSVVIESVPHAAGDAASAVAGNAPVPLPAEPVPAPAPAPAEPPAAPLPADAASAPSGSAEAVALASLNALVVRARSRAWIEVQDAGKRVLIARDLQAGETVGLDGTPPLRVRLGNASATTLTYRGQAVNLGPSTRGNIAQLELK